MNSLVLFLNRFSNWQTLVGLLLLYLIFPFVLLKNAEAKINELAGKEIGPIDLKLGFNPDRTLQMVEDYGDAGRAYYKQVELSVDLAYPLVYALLFAVMLTIIYRRLLKRPVLYLNMIPFVAMVFDYLENITIVSMLSHYPEQSMAMAAMCEIFKSIKFLLFGLILFLMAYGLIKIAMLKKPPST